MKAKLELARIVATATRAGSIVLMTALSGCSGMFFSSAKPVDNPVNWAADGSIVVARAAPAPQSLAPDTMLGFLPGTVPALASPAEKLGPWLSINRNLGTATLMDGATEVDTFRGEGLEKIPGGTFHVMLKERNPLWYAPDSYFTSRHLDVPPPGDKARFRRGALGDFVMFLDKDTPVHSGPVWSTDIGGARLDEDDLSRVYYRLDLGSIVEVK